MPQLTTVYKRDFEANLVNQGKESYTSLMETLTTGDLLATLQDNLTTDTDAVTVTVTLFGISVKDDKEYSIHSLHYTVTQADLDENLVEYKANFAGLENVMLVTSKLNTVYPERPTYKRFISRVRLVKV